MTSARIKPFCKNYDISIGCFDGKRINPTNITEGNISFYIYNNRFCLIWKSNGTNFNKAIEEVKLNFKVLDKVMSGKLLKSFVEYEYDPKLFNLH